MFLDSLEDISVNKGDEAGFQFQYKCPSCKKAFASSFFPASVAPGKGIVKKFFKSSENAGENPTWKQEREDALLKAGDELESCFEYCRKCMKHVCKKCWNSIRDLCMPCCVGAAQMAYDKALVEQELQKKQDSSIYCSKCGERVVGVKFCPKCGNKIVPKGVCPNCSHKVAPNAVFCTECGTKLT